MSDLFSREIYSDRPHFHMAGDIMGSTNITPTAPHGNYWRAHRRLYQKLNNDSELSKSILAISDDVSRALMLSFLKGKSNPLDDLRLSVETHCTSL